MALSSIVRRNQNLVTLLFKRLDQSLGGLALQARLITDRDQYQPDFFRQRAQAGLDRCEHALLVTVVRYQLDPWWHRRPCLWRDLPRDLVGLVPEHHPDFIHARRAKRVDHAFEHGLAAERKKLLGPAHAPRLPRRQNDRDVHSTSPAGLPSILSAS